MTTPLNDRRLIVDAVDVRLGGLQILRGVSFEVEPGAAFGIIGPNGAGKTTLLNVLSGVVRPTAGTVRYGEVDLRHARPHKIRAYGIGRSLQSTHYFRELTVQQLVSLGELPNSVLGAAAFRAHRANRLRRGSGSRREAASSEHVRSALEQFDLIRYRDRPLSELSSALQKTADIARAVVAGTHLLLLDEPTSGVSGSARGAIAEALQALRQMGRTVVLIDHDPKFVVGNCDRLMAMNFGEVLHVGTPAEVMNNETVQRSYLGESAES